MSEALCENYEKVARVIDGVVGFVRDHPTLCALIALRILILLSPWVIEALGFAEGGIVRGERRACFHSVTTLHRYSDQRWAQGSKSRKQGKSAVSLTRQGKSSDWQGKARR